MDERAGPLKEKARIPSGDHVVLVLGELRSAVDTSISLSVFLTLEPFSSTLKE
jgi:hypothetical protein